MAITIRLDDLEQLIFDAFDRPGRDPVQTAVCARECMLALAKRAGVQARPWETIAMSAGGAQPLDRVTPDNSVSRLLGAS